MSKIAVVTGVTGQDGALLSNFLLQKDYQVVGVVRRTSSPSVWRLQELGVLNNSNFCMVSGDITDQGSIDRIVSTYKPDELYNLAAQSFVGISWDQPELTMNITGLGAIKVFESVRKHNPSTKIYQASSSEMFGGAYRTELLNEESSFCPRSPYGVAKCTAHHMAKVYRESYHLFISCGILFNHESEYRGLEFVTRKITDGVAKIKLGLADSIQLGNLQTHRDWGYAKDFVEGMWLMLQHIIPRDFVLATGKEHSVEEFVKTAFEVVGIDDYKSYIAIDPKFNRPADVGFLLGDASRAKNYFNWKPKVSFEEMIKLMVEKDIKRLS